MARTADQVFAAQRIKVADAHKAAMLNVEHGLDFDTASHQIARILAGNAEEVAAIQEAILSYHMRGEAA